jgi:hypothetical protein
VGDQFSERIVIDVGTEDGIEEDQPVVVGENTLVGRTTNVSRHTAQVMLITDRMFAAGVRIVPPAEFDPASGEVSPAVTAEDVPFGQGMLKTSLEGYFGVDYVDQSLRAEEGDYVVTSGRAAGRDLLEPPGLYVGTVESVTSQDIDQFKKIVVDPAMSPDDLEDVRVIVGWTGRGPEGDGRAALRRPRLHHRGRGRAPRGGARPLPYLRLRLAEVRPDRHSLRRLAPAGPAGRAPRVLRRHPARLFKQRLFGVGALAGLAAGALSGRVSAVRRKGTERVLLSQVVAVCVAAFGLLAWTARHLAGYGGPPLAEYAVAGILPDALLNAVLAYLVGGWLLKIVNVKSRVWESD